MTSFTPWHTGYPVHVAVHPMKGRQMIAARDITANEVLLADSPYCWVVDDSAKEFVCQNCFLEKDPELSTFVGCPDCNQVFYCSEECQNIDSVQHSQDECGILKAMETEEYSAAIITEMKLLVRTLSRKSTEKLYQKKPPKEFPVMPNDNGLTYEDYCQLVSNRENFPQATIESLEYWICDYIRRLGEWVGHRKESNIELLDILLRNRCNAFYIQGRLREHPATKDMVGQSRGCGIYVRNSFFNHSCRPNVNYWVVENSLRVECTAGEAVAQGEELCISYIDTQQDLASRRAKLQESYLFTCDCARCTEEEAGGGETAEANGGDEEEASEDAGGEVEEKGEQLSEELNGLKVSQKANGSS